SYNPNTFLVACLFPVHRCNRDSVGAAGLSIHLLLLSRRVLQRLVGRSTLLRGGRASQDLLGGAQVAAADSEFSSLFFVRSNRVYRDSFLRRLEGVLVQRTIRCRGGLAGAAGESDFAGAVHI